MLHTEERPHKCNFCGKGFIRVCYLKVHMKKHHANPNDLYSGRINVNYEVTQTN